LFIEFPYKIIVDQQAQDPRKILGEWEMHCLGFKIWSLCSYSSKCISRLFRFNIVFWYGLRVHTCLALVLRSMQNWAEDLYFRELDLNYPGVTDAMVQAIYLLSFVSPREWFVFGYWTWSAQNTRRESKNVVHEVHDLHHFRCFHQFYDCAFIGSRYTIPLERSLWLLQDPNSLEFPCMITQCMMISYAIM